MTAPPAGWFTRPRLPGKTPLTVTSSGRVYGHVASWDQPHIGIDGEEIYAPHSLSGYRWFRTGAVLTDDGALVATGRLTVGTGHADPLVGVRPAIEHYDHTGAAVADVAIGEDEHGIWVAGAVRPGAAPEQVHALRGSPLSGDWRWIDGEYELVAALAVNTPGFPIPREADTETPALVASGRPPALLAVGVVTGTIKEDTVPDDVTEHDDDTTPDDATLSPEDDAALTEAWALLGLDDDASTTDVLDAVRALLDQPDLEPGGLPDGVVMIEQEQLAALQASAARGDQARAQQETEYRAALVASAVRDGRIPTARSEHWLAQLAADPGAETVLASLQPGLIPVDGPIGTSKETDLAPADQQLGDDYWFPGFAHTTSREG